jgi:hypothetical protein
MNSPRIEIDQATKAELMSRISQLKELNFIQLSSLPPVTTDKLMILKRSVTFTILVDSKTDHHRIAVAVRSDERRFGFIDSGITEGFFKSVQDDISDMSWSDIRDYFE